MQVNAALEKLCVNSSQFAVIMVLHFFRALVMSVGMKLWHDTEGEEIWSVDWSGIQ